MRELRLRAEMATKLGIKRENSRAIIYAIGEAAASGPEPVTQQVSLNSLSGCKSPRKPSRIAEDQTRSRIDIGRTTLASKAHPDPNSTSASPTTQGVDTGALLQTLVRRYQKRKRPISVNFRSFFPALNSADRSTHLIHPYPAKLLTHIPFLFLSNDLLSKPGDIVLDPFCGSGTVLLEARLANRNAYGVDANPLARLVARVKTSPIDPDELRRAFRQILRRIPKKPSGPCPDVVNLEHWFYPSTVKKLQCIHEAIEGIADSAARDFFLICFSVCIRKVSLADPRLSVPVRLKIGQYPEDHPLQKESDSHLRSLRRINVANVFSRVARTNIARMERLAAHESTSLVEIPCSDARDLAFEFSMNGNRGKPLANHSVQLVITSPPYPGAQKYIRSSSLSLGWLGLCGTHELRAYKACTIGREEFTKEESKRIPTTNILDADRVLAEIAKRNAIRAVIAATYLNEMRAAFQEMFRVLRPGGSIVIVAANNRIARKEFRTVEYLRTIADQLGLSLMACFIDAIRSRGLMTKRNHTASVITREWVLIFTKGDLPGWSR